VLTPAARRVVEKEKFGKAKADLVKRLAAAAALEEKPVLPSGRTRRRNTGKGVSVDKITLEHAKGRMLQAVEAHHVDFSAGITKERNPSPPQDGISRMKLPTGPAAKFFFVSADNGWHAEPCDSGYWVRDPLPLPRPGYMRRDRDDVKDGAVPSGGLKELQKEWLKTHVDLHLECDTNKQAHKMGAYSRVSLAMCDSIGFQHFLGMKQIQGWVEKARAEHFKSELARKQGEVAAARAIAEAGGGAGSSNT
jgi:hypothetical protein